MFYTVAQIMTANRKAGQHFFDRATLQHWHSEIGTDSFPLSYVDGALFITSESFDEGRTRVYTVRRALVTGHIEANALPRLATEQQAREAVSKIMEAYRKADSVWSRSTAEQIIAEINRAHALFVAARNREHHTI